MLEPVRSGTVHHVLLYGAPASGKLTVAQALAARTGFRVVHNHLTTDLVSQLLDRDAPGFWDLVKELRLRLFATAAARGIHVVSTTAYVSEDRPWIAEIEAAIQSHGQVHFVALRPSVETLEQRVLSQSRQNHRKLQTVESLRAALADADYFSPINRGRPRDRQRRPQRGRDRRADRRSLLAVGVGMRAIDRWLLPRPPIERGRSTVRDILRTESAEHDEHTDHQIAGALGSRRTALVPVIEDHQAFGRHNADHAGDRIRERV